MKSLLRTAVLATSLLGFAGAGWTAEGKATRVSEHGEWAVFVLSLIHISEPTRPY